MTLGAGASWSEFHGGETIGVKALEIVNLPALAATVLAEIAGAAGLARLTSACTWSWFLAGLFLFVSSAQWWLIGGAIDLRIRRVRTDSDRPRTVR